jgi:amino acid adenylation domain-containing protein
MPPPERGALRDGFLHAAERFASRPALEVAGEQVRYDELKARAAALAATLAEHDAHGEVVLTAVFGQRSATAYVAILAALLRGHGYVPLNPAFPAARNSAMLARSLCTALVADAAASAQLDELLQNVERGMVIVLPDHDDVSAFAARWPRHRVVGRRSLEPAAAWRPGEVTGDAIAYLLFTSGSTGEPKGVMVSNANVRHFVACMVERYGITEHDRFSQTFDLTFDLSAFDLFVAWQRGACVCVPSAAQKMMPGKYLADAALTVWFSVPSTAALMSRLRMLAPGRYPRLRWSLFCGEALPAELAQRWLAAAPASRLENLYGPTELTIACTLYRWDAARSPAQCELGLVPIGEPYPGMSALVADEQLREVAVGEAGELLMAGPQVALGYYRDASRSAAAFVVPPGRGEVHYRTGDRVRRPAPGRPLTYLGRIDNQIKVLGYRVELGEIEALARAQGGVDEAVALGWPLSDSGAEGIVVFVADAACDVAALRRRLAERLPPYMQPREVRALAHFPKNANGKIDRKALARLLADDAAAR